MKRQLHVKEECHATLSFLGLYDYVATKIEVYNEDTGKLETFRLLNEDELPFTDNESLYRSCMIIEYQMFTDV